MKVSILVALCYCASTFGFAAQVRPQPEVVRTFELYSWQDAGGKWNFSLFPGDLSAGIAPEVIMNKSTALVGLKMLEMRLSTLPAGSSVVWLNHALGMYEHAESNHLLKYPPSQIVGTIRHYCETRKVKIEF